MIVGKSWEGMNSVQSTGTTDKYKGHYGKSFVMDLHIFLLRDQLVEEMEEAFSNFKARLVEEKPGCIIVLLRLTMTRRTFSRLQTHQSPFSSCGLFSTFSHR